MNSSLDREKYLISYMDTDSAYLSCSSLDIEKCVLPEQSEYFFANYEKYHVPRFCPAHKRQWVESMTLGSLFVQPRCCHEAEEYHNKTMGLFKTEFLFRKLIILNSKSYYGLGFTSDVKQGRKSISRATTLTYDKYSKALEGERVLCDVRGITSTRQGAIYTYGMEKAGLSMFYPKAYVCDDLISIEGYDI